MSVDRFFVGAYLSIAAVAYYATPLEAVTRLLIIPSAIAAVLFPAFSTASVINRARMAELFRAGVWTVFLTMYPIAFIVITFAPEILRLWLGSTFAEQSTDVLRWLALGVLMNSLASLPFALLQGIGRSDTTAKIHLAEAPVYIVLMVWLIQGYGIKGAAIAWCARTTLDMLLLSWYTTRQLPTTVSVRLRDIVIFVALTAALGVGLLAQSPLQKLILTSIFVLPFSVLAWRWTLTTVRRTRIAPIPERLG